MKKVEYGTILRGQMYVQYMIPAAKRHPILVVLVGGGDGQSTHYLGPGSGQSGWAYYYLQEGPRRSTPTPWAGSRRPSSTPA
jgi:hypothetical protein